MAVLSNVPTWKKTGMTRFPPIRPQDMYFEQKQVAEAINRRVRRQIIWDRWGYKLMEGWPHLVG